MNYTSPVTTALINSMKGGAPQAVVKEVKCEVCEIMVSSFVSFRLFTF